MRLIRSLPKVLAADDPVRYGATVRANAGRDLAKKERRRRKRHTLTAEGELPEPRGVADPYEVLVDAYWEQYAREIFERRLDEWAGSDAKKKKTVQALRERLRGQATWAQLGMIYDVKSETLERRCNTALERAVKATIAQIHWDMAREDTINE